MRKLIKIRKFDTKIKCYSCFACKSDTIDWFISINRFTKVGKKLEKILIKMSGLKNEYENFVFELVSKETKRSIAFWITGDDIFIGNSAKIE